MQKTIYRYIVTALYEKKVLQPTRNYETQHATHRLKNISRQIACDPQNAPMVSQDAKPVFSPSRAENMFARDTKDRQAPNSWASGGHCWPQLSILKTLKYTVVFDWHCYFHELLGLVTLLFWLVYMPTISVLGFLGWRFTFLQMLRVHIFPDNKNVRLTVTIHTIA